MGDLLLHVIFRSNTIEAQAISRAIALASEVGCSHIIIIIQSDCLQENEGIQAGSFPSTVAAGLFNDIYTQASISCDRV